MHSDQKHPSQSPAKEGASAIATIDNGGIDPTTGDTAILAGNGAPESLDLDDTAPGDVRRSDRRKQRLAERNNRRQKRIFGDVGSETEFVTVGDDVVSVSSSSDDELHQPQAEYRACGLNDEPGRWMVLKDELEYCSMIDEDILFSIAREESLQATIRNRDRNCPVEAPEPDVSILEFPDEGIESEAVAQNKESLTLQDGLDKQGPEIAHETLSVDEDGKDRSALNKSPDFAMQRRPDSEKLNKDQDAINSEFVALKDEFPEHILDDARKIYTDMLMEQKTNGGRLPEIDYAISVAQDRIKKTTESMCTNKVDEIVTLDDDVKEAPKVDLTNETREERAARMAASFSNIMKKIAVTTDREECPSNQF